MIPKNFQLVYSQAQIAGQVARLGAEISKWAEKVWSDEEQEILTVPVLGGGIFFFADLVRSIGTSLEILPLKTWGYVGETNQALDEVKADIGEVKAKGRRVLLVDDICDSGRTLASLKRQFLAAGAAEVRSAVLLKRIMDKETFDPDWIGFEHKGKEWFVGYGMDDRGHWRNLPSVFIIQ